MDTTSKPVVIFSAIYILIATAFAIVYQNWEFVFYIVMLLIIASLIAILHARVRLSRNVLWALSLWGLFHMIGGLVPTPASWPVNGDQHVFYSLWIIPGYLKFDHLIHAYGFGTATWVSWEALKSMFKSAKPTFGVLLFCMFCGMGLGAVNELIEFAAVLLIPETNVGGYENTGWDLVANAFGSTIAALSISLWQGKKA